MKNEIWKKVFLLLILILGAFLRLIRIDSIPPSPSLDEVSIGYNAYSILKTSRDEFGVRYPIILRAYDDYRPASYVYLVMPFLIPLGLTVNAVRLPSVIMGVADIFLMYGISSLLFSSSSALFSAFLIAISPWHIYLSRLGHEANLGLFMVIFGLYLYLLTVTGKSKSGLMVVSSAVFALSLNSYQSQKMIVPLLVLALVILWRKWFYSRVRISILSLVVGLVISIPIVFVSLKPESLTRLKGTSAFNENSRYEREASLYGDAKKQGDEVGAFLHSRKLVSLSIFSDNYLSHFNPAWLFGGKAEENHKVPFMGLLYPFESLLLFAGFIYLWWQKKYGIENISVPLLLLFLSPLPAAITTQAPHAMRAMTMQPALHLIGGIGATALFQCTKHAGTKLFLGAIFGITVMYCLWQFSWNYYSVFPRTQSRSFQKALSQSILEVLQMNRVKKVIVSNTDNLYQSYMFYLFHSKYDPYIYQLNGGTRSGGFRETHTIDLWEFRPVVWGEDGLKPETVYVTNPGEIPTGIGVQKTIYYLNGIPGVIITSYQ